VTAVPANCHIDLHINGDQNFQEGGRKSVISNLLSFSYFLHYTHKSHTASAAGSPLSYSILTLAIGVTVFELEAGI